LNIIVCRDTLVYISKRAQFKRCLNVTRSPYCRLHSENVNVGHANFTLPVLSSDKNKKFQKSNDQMSTSGNPNGWTQS